MKKLRYYSDGTDRTHLCEDKMKHSTAGVSRSCFCRIDGQKSTALLIEYKVSENNDLCELEEARSVQLRSVPSFSLSRLLIDEPFL